MRTVIRTLDELIAAGTIEDGTLVLPAGEYAIEGFTIDLAELKVRLLAFDGPGPVTIRDCTIVGAGQD